MSERPSTHSMQPMQRDRDTGRLARPTPGTGSKASPGPDKPSHMPGRRAWLIFLVILGVNYLAMRLLVPGGEEPITIPYTGFKEQVEKGNVESIYSKGASIDGRFKKPVTWPPPGSNDSKDTPNAKGRPNTGFAGLLEQPG